jgi:hypothetical protein
MKKLILELLWKMLIGGLKIAVLMFATLYLCNYIGKLYGESYGFILFLIISTIIIVISNRVKKKNAKEFLGNSEDYTKSK